MTFKAVLTHLAAALAGVRLYLAAQRLQWLKPLDDQLLGWRPLPTFRSA